MALARVVRAEGGFGVVDGALATELERRGAAFHPALWSATALLDRPDLIRAVHEEYVAAGANVLITASYQATLPGLLAARSVPAAHAERLLGLSVELAREAAAARPNVLVAASVANYGAYLADGSEFTGAYAARLSADELTAFLRPHAAALHAARPDLLAFETVSSLREADAICTLLSELPGPVEAYVSFACRDGAHIADGSPLAAAAARLEACAAVSAIGVNCTAPAHVSSLLASLPPSRLLRLVYPNSGERYDGAAHCWRGEAEALFCGPPDALAATVRDWHARGAHLVGGCCRTAPRHTAVIRHALSTAPAHPLLP